MRSIPLEGQRVTFTDRKNNRHTGRVTMIHGNQVTVKVGVKSYPIKVTDIVKVG